MKNHWNIIHDISVVYMYFMDLGKENESNFKISLEKMKKEIHKWEFSIDNKLYGIKHNNPENYNVLYTEMTDEFFPSPLDQINRSMKNLVDYFNSGILNIRIIHLLFHSINKCIGDDICEAQAHQMEYYTKMWMHSTKPVSPDLKILNQIMVFKLSFLNPDRYLLPKIQELEEKGTSDVKG